MSFVEKMIAAEGGLIRLIVTTENGKPCWFVLRLDPLKYKEYQKNMRRESHNIVDYGEILESAWGDVPKGKELAVLIKKYDIVKV